MVPVAQGLAADAGPCITAAASTGGCVLLSCRALEKAKAGLVLGAGKLEEAADKARAWCWVLAAGAGCWVQPCAHTIRVADLSFVGSCVLGVAFSILGRVQLLLARRSSLWALGKEDRAGQGIRLRRSPASTTTRITAFAGPLCLWVLAAQELACGSLAPAADLELLALR